MSLLLRGLASVLIFLTSAGCARRVQRSTQQWQKIPCAECQNPSLPALVAAIDPDAAFTPVGPEVRLPVSNPTPGVGASKAEKEAWVSLQSVRRSYHDEVVVKIEALKEKYNVQKYGAVSIDPQRYPLYAVMTRGWSTEKPSLLVTGGVHGSETSGIHGAILFLENAAEAYSKTFNILVVPCVNPWGYETVNRENAQVRDPNRSFHPDGGEQQTEESLALMRFLQSLEANQWMCHIDLHEQNSRRGFHLVSDKTKPRRAWHNAIITAVRKVTHLVRAEPNDMRLKLFEQHGVMTIDSPSSMGMCSGLTDATYATTFEAYPESPPALSENDNSVQVTGLVAAVEHIIQAEKL